MKFSIPFLTNRVSVSDRSFMTRQLATMLSSGLAIDRAIAVLATQVGNQYLKSVFAQIESDLEAGLTFSKAIAKHPRVFNRVFVNVVMAGEAVGKVAEVLEEMATQLEKEHEFLGKFWGALYYPILIMVGIVVVGLVMIIKIVPQFREVFLEANVPLPLTTQFLIAFSEFISTRWYIALTILIAAGFGLRVYLQTARGQQFLDWLALYVPTGILRYFYMARFTRTLALLTQSGTPIIEALGITSEVVNNSFYSEEIRIAKDEVSRGIPLSVPLSKSKIFPTIVPQMVLVGEQTGRMDEVLGHLADYYEEETNNKLKALSSLFEPIMLIIVGLGVAFIVFAIFIPIYSIARFQ